VQASRELIAVLNLADKEAQKRGDQFISSEMVLLALTDDKSDAGKLARENGLSRKALEAAIRRARRRQSG
jgi:ATP-dependent Clp protease ATP-binding subunit ClpB